MPRKKATSPRRAIAIGLVSLIAVVVAGRAASADIAVCGTYPPPADSATALARALFAFDGVVVDGRKAGDSGRGAELVSPLTFRVTQWLKGGGSLYGTMLPSGAQGVKLWDGRYGRMPIDSLSSYSLNVRERFPGELAASPGQAWRVYATNENGVNFTCTNYLGSHPIAFATSPRPVRHRTRMLVWVLALGILAVFIWAAIRLAKARRDRFA